MRKVEERQCMRAGTRLALTSKEEGWTPPAGVPAEYTPQAVASFKIDEKAHSKLVNEFDEAASPRDSRRLQEDGDKAIMSPHHFRTAVLYRLGIPLLTNEIPCPLCTQPIYPNGDHATCCAKTGDCITRHNALRNMVANIANQGMLSPVLEKQVILGSAPGRRPRDVTIQNWCDGKGLAIDVAVTSPFLGPTPCQQASMRVLCGAIQAQEVRERLQRQQLFVLGCCVGNNWCCERRGKRKCCDKSDAIRIQETRSRAQLVLRAPMGPPVDLPPERSCQDDSVANW